MEPELLRTGADPQEMESTPVATSTPAGSSTSRGPNDNPENQTSSAAARPESDRGAGPEMGVRRETTNLWASHTSMDTSTETKDTTNDKIKKNKRGGKKHKRKRSSSSTEQKCKTPRPGKPLIQPPRFSIDQDSSMPGPRTEGNSEPVLSLIHI